MNFEDKKPDHKVDRKKIPIKKTRLSEHKKSLTIGSLIAIVAIAGIVTGIIILQETDKKGESILIVGVSETPPWIDPIESWYDYPFIQQVTEKLFIVDVVNNNYETIANPNLVLDYSWSTDGLNFTCILRQDVTFHDGTQFNATSVKWNFDRIHRLLDTPITYSNLWRLPDGRTIINETQVIDNFTVRFVLNAPYAPFKNLLSIFGASILSPSSTPANDFIDKTSEKLIGTGPFTYNFFEENKNLTLTANDNYWSGKPSIDKLVFLVIENITDWKIADALLSGEIDVFRGLYFNETMLNIFKENSSFIVEDEIIPNLRWLVMNNQKINVTMRKAISYAINYSAIIEDRYKVWGEKVIRAHSPIPEAIPYYNITGINVSYYNLSIARQTLIEGIGPKNSYIASLPLDNDTAWEWLTDNKPIATYNFTYISDIALSFNIGPEVAEFLKKIGIKIEVVGVTYEEWRYMMYEEYGFHRNMFRITINFWTADFNDPSNFIDQWYTNKAIAENVGQVNDTLVQQWMEEALVEVDDNIRKNLYYKIQKRLIEEVYPHIWLHSSVTPTIYVSNLQGVKINYYRLNFESVYFE